jgi:hypothetical protein
VIRALLASFAFLAACSSSSSSGSSPPAGDGGGSGACPDVSGTWKVTAHCDSSLIGQTAPVTQNGCSLTFGGLFNGFTATVTTDNKISVSGPQTCSGTVAGNSIAMTCTPGTCSVTLSR